MIKQHEINSIRKGAGSLRHYDYYANGIKLGSKTAILEAVDLKISQIKRVDKTNNQVEQFDYKKMDFGVI